MIRAQIFYLMHTWDLTRIITLKYLKSFNGPYDFIRPQYKSSKVQGHNRFITEI